MVLGNESRVLRTQMSIKFVHRNIGTTSCNQNTMDINEFGKRQDSQVID
jgi:hypothetical protein